jgi:hypothetical protein
MEGVEHRRDTLRIRVIPPATDDYPHALNIAPNAPKVQRERATQGRAFAIPPLRREQAIAGNAGFARTPKIVASAPKVQRDSTDLHSKRAIAILVPSVVLAAYAGGLIDHDSGGYRDSFRPLPDKQAHFLGSVVLGKAVADGTSVKLGLATCLVAGLAWEAGQSRHHGHASSQDATYDAGGCLVGALWGRR